MIFYKFESYGNDFIVVENISLLKSQIVKLCSLHHGVGSDGLIILNSHRMYDGETLIFNQDGSRAKMCGNGLKIIACYLYEVKKIIKDEYKILLNEVVFIVGRKNNLYYLLTQKAKYLGKLNEYEIYNIGNNHLIKMCDLIVESELYRVGIKEKNYNVSFIQKINDQTIKILTYERGVGITNSCGSASLCAFEYMKRIDKTLKSINILSKGGRYKIENIFDYVCLYGKVNYVYKGEIEIEH